MTANEKSEFARRLVAVLEGTASEAEFRAVEAAMLADPECVRLYRQQAEMNLLLAVDAQLAHRRRWAWIRPLA